MDRGGEPSSPRAGTKAETRAGTKAGDVEGAGAGLRGPALASDHPLFAPRGAHSADFVLQKVQPALLGLMDGSVSTLGPIFAAAGLTHDPRKTFLVGLAASVGAGISMGLAEALSDDGEITGRGAPFLRGLITAIATITGGMLHTFPFLLPDIRSALVAAYAVVFVELIAIAFIRYHFMRSPLGKTLVQVIVGGATVFAVGVMFGRLA